MDLDKALAIKALEKLDDLLIKESHGPMTLIVGGGGAMILAHGFAGKTKDIDAVAKGRSDLMEIDAETKVVAQQLKIEPDWLNPYFSTFIHYLPKDYGSRLLKIYDGVALHVIGLGAEDLLIMKFMADRDKDQKHIRHLIKRGAQIEVVEERLIELEKQKVTKAKEALARFYETCDEMGL